MSALKAVNLDPQERGTAREALRTLAAATGPGALAVTIPDAARQPLLQILSLIVEGHAPRVLSDDEELTTQEAADLLKVSRPTLLKRLEEGEIPWHWVGSHRRMKVVDVLAYRERRDQSALSALQELVAEEEELGLRG